MDELTPEGRVVIAGGTGFLGLNLARYLSDLGCEVVLVSRKPAAESGPWRHEAWDARTVGPWARALEGASALVNLVGRTVDCVKTPDHCDEIMRSRVEATRVLGDALRSISHGPSVWVQMSTAHIYGDPPAAVCDESSAFGYGLAPTVGKAWEAAFRESVPNGCRPVVLRTSFVLGRRGGALRTLARLARFGLGGTVGHGQQGMSWIHEADMNRIFARAIGDPTMEGAYIASAPVPVSNKEFMRELRRALRVPFGLPAAAWQVKLAAPLLLRTDPELALYGRYCVPKRLIGEGFVFTYPDVAGALGDIFSRSR
jgi:uncharacterized protein (TIGR01777 family)